MRTLLNNRDAVDLAQVRRFIVGTLSTDQAENVGEVIYVDGAAGSDTLDGKSPDRAKRTITAALAVAVAYDVVAVFPGTYAEHVTMAVANVSLVGLGDVPRQVLLSSAVDLVTPYITISAGGCCVANLRVSNLHANNVVGILVNAANCLIEGCDLVREPAGGVAQDQGIQLLGAATICHHNVIRDCHFDFCTLGILLVAVGNVMPTANYIKGCDFSNGVTSDISDGAAAHVITGIYIEDCHFRTVLANVMVNLRAAAHTGTFYGNDCPGAWSRVGGVNLAALILTARCYTVVGCSGAAPA